MTKMTVNRELRKKYRFELNYVKKENHQCWEWRGKKDSKGYGIFNWGAGKSHKAHRISFELYNKPIPPAMQICHSCDNRRCVNPNHLWIGTPKENAKDRDEKGRFKKPIGEKNGRCKITENTAKEIKKRIMLGEPMIKIAREMNIPYTTIANIKSGASWKHLKY